MALFDVNFKALEKDLSFRLKRQNLISSNLANHNTPGFQSKDIRFDEALNSVYDKDRAGESLSEMTLTDDMHMDFRDGMLQEVVDPENYVVQAEGIDENGVDLDREMARMAENSLMYSASTTALKKKLGMLRYAAQEAAK